MDTFLIIAGIILLIGGIVGSIVPFLPGPPLSYIAIILLHMTSKYQFSTTFLVVWGIVVALVVVLDYIIPIIGTKKFGGTKYGVWGSTIGLLIGMFLLPPFGIIVGPFAGAFIGEYVNEKNTEKAFRSAWGSFIGFITGTLVKIVVCIILSYFFISKFF